MRRIASSLAAGALALGALGLLGGPASASTPTLTLTQPSGTTVAIDGAAFTLTATASEAGAVAFSANGVAIPGCAAEETVSLVATCPWTPALTPPSTNPVSITAVLTPTITTDPAADAAAVTVTTSPVALTGSAVYLGQNAKFTATTYSAGSVTFSDSLSGTTLPNCGSVSNVLNANGTAYTASCTLSDPGSNDTITAAFTPNNVAYASGTNTYSLVVNTVVLSGGSGAIVGVATTLTASANESGTMTFNTLSGGTPTAISGCSSVATASTAAPYTFNCSYTAAAAGAASVQGVLTPTSGPSETSPTDLTVTAAVVVLSGGSAIYGVSPGEILAETGTNGAVSFDTVSGGTPTAISGCSNVTSLTSSSPFEFLCTWTPAAAGPATLGASFTPTGGTAVLATDLAVTVGEPVQGQEYPISMYVDTIIASGASGAAAPIIGAGCEISNEFIVGQTIVFRVYGNDAELDGAPLTPSNVSSAQVTIAGWSGSPLTLSYASHGGVAFWTAALKTGTSSGAYDTLGIIPYTVTFKTNAVPGVAAVTKSEPVYKKEWVTIIRHGKQLRVKRRVLVGHQTVVVTPAVPAIPGATGTFNSAFNPASQATLNAIPTV